MNEHGWVSMLFLLTSLPTLFFRSPITTFYFSWYVIGIGSLHTDESTFHSVFSLKEIVSVITDYMELLRVFLFPTFWIKDMVSHVLSLFFFGMLSMCLLEEAVGLKCYGAVINCDLMVLM